MNVAPGTLVNGASGGTLTYCAPGIHVARHHERSRRMKDTRPLWGLSTACAAVVCAVAPPVIASRLVCKRVCVLDAQDISRHFGGAHQAKGYSEIDYYHERSRRP